MGFRDREKRRIEGIKSDLFSAAATRAGIYKKKCREFCLHGEHASENLHESIRTDALRYFIDRSIGWHDGSTNARGETCPSNHLLCSQSACVNAWFPFARDPRALLRVVKQLGYAADAMLPMEHDVATVNAAPPFVSFEWIGRRNYLNELSRGERAADETRSRGRNFTSADFAFRFRSGGEIHLVLGEWKYTEYYPVNRSKRYGSGVRRTDRLTIYGKFLTADGSPIRLPPGVHPEDLMFDPFDQLMRLQLLASEMQRDGGEMNATHGSVLHVAPRCNAELMQRVTSPGLKGRGSDLHDIWGTLVADGRFRGCASEDLFEAMLQHAPDPSWGRYLLARYADMR